MDPRTPHWGRLSAPTLAAGIVGAACLVAWVVVELRSHDPLINLHVIKLPDVLLAKARPAPASSHTRPAGVNPPDTSFS